MKPSETLFDRFLIEAAYIDENLARAAQEVAAAAGPKYKTRWKYDGGYVIVLSVPPLPEGDNAIRIPLKMTGHPAKKTWVAFDVSALPTAAMLALKVKYDAEPFADNTHRQPTLELEFESVKRAYEFEGDEDE